MSNGTRNSQNFQISRKKGQPLEAVQNFRNEFPETFCSIQFCTSISGNFGPMDRAQILQVYCALKTLPLIPLGKTTSVMDCFVIMDCADWPKFDTLDNQK